MDLAVEYNHRTHIIEIKLIHAYNSHGEVLEEGLEQIAKYRDRIDKGAPAYLVIFDRRPDAKARPWDEKIYWREVPVPSGIVTVVGC